jgi:peptidoglycan/xylan/chitin deacetylase (PgdA/CDA1 family)
MFHQILYRYRCPETLIAMPAGSHPLDHSARSERTGVSPPNTLVSRPDDSRTDIVSALCFASSAIPKELSPCLDFDAAVELLTHERYMQNSADGGPNPYLRRAYYALRPLVPAALRLQVQRLYFGQWKKLKFPAWPLDVSVENLIETALAALMKTRRMEAMPFIWFWPDGATCSVALTHDVETGQGLDSCPRLMDMDEAFGFRSIFFLVPERRYSMKPALLDEIRARGHEVGVHDLNHDGKLFSDRRLFLERVKAVNQYGRDWKAKGFRSAVLYRNLGWFDQLEFEYDMSVPNVGHLEAQRGGCCTVFPYFIDRLLELPLTTVQDHSLFHILRQDRIDLWKSQARLVMEKNGLLTFLVHPDYLTAGPNQRLYRALLGYLAELKAERRVWTALPSEVNHWWRQRSNMTLVQEGEDWRIQGPGSERARVAYARLDGDRVVYTFDGPHPRSGAPAGRSSSSST